MGKQLRTLAKLPEVWLPYADAGVVQRGLDYFKRQLVKPRKMGRGASGQDFWVQGTQRYAVHIDAAQPLLSQCDCPHAELVLVCKHMVAAWLYLAGEAADQPEAAAVIAEIAVAAEATRKSSKQSAKIDEIKANLQFLQAQTSEALCEWIAEQCDRDSQLAQQLSLWRRNNQDVPQSTAQWRSYLTRAMPQRQSLYGKGLQAWADMVLEALKVLQAQAAQQPDQIRAAATMGLQRLFRLWETADDSDGQLYEVYEFLQQVLRQSLQHKAPPASWLKDWLALMEADPLQHWDEPELLAIAGEELGRAYSRYAIDAWTALSCQPVKPRRKAAASWRADSDDFDRLYERSRLRRRYLWAMAQSQDLTAQIQLARQTAESAEDWLELLEFCEEHQRPREAQAMSQLAIEAFPEHFLLMTARLKCLRRDGWDDEAEVMARRLLDETPGDLMRLDEWLDCVKALGRDPEQALDAAIAQRTQRPAPSPRTRSGDERLDLSVPLQWLMHRQQSSKALALAQQHPSAYLDRSTLRELALSLPPEQRERTIQLLEALLHQMMEYAHSPYYHELKLVQLIFTRLQPEQRPPWLQALRERYGRKTNFIKGLKGW